MYRSIFHARPLLNGYQGYWPPGFSERMQLATMLPASFALDMLCRQTGLELILVHSGELSERQRAVWLAAAEDKRRGNPRLAARDGDDLLFRTDPRLCARLPDEPRARDSSRGKEPVLAEGLKYELRLEALAPQSSVAAEHLRELRGS
jgi:hypothetical protein